MRKRGVGRLFSDRGGLGFVGGGEGEGEWGELGFGGKVRCII